MWEELKDERELRDDFWSCMEKIGGAMVASNRWWIPWYADSCESPSIVLNVQRELVGQKLSLQEAIAGKPMLPKVEERIARSGLQLTFPNRRCEGFRKAERIEDETRRNCPNTGEQQKEARAIKIAARR
jgi:hypothetical protein